MYVILKCVGDNEGDKQEEKLELIAYLAKKLRTKIDIRKEINEIGRI